MRNFLYESDFNYGYLINNHTINEAVLYAYPKTFVEQKMLNIFKTYDDKAILIKTEEKLNNAYNFKINATLKNFNVKIIKYDIENILNFSEWKIRMIVLHDDNLKFNKFSSYNNFIDFINDNEYNKFNVTFEFIPNKLIYNAYKNNENIVTLDVNNYDYIYHLTDKKYVNRILKNGLIPKSGNKLGYNPEVIHLLKYLTDPGVICKIIEQHGEYKLKVDPKLKLENPILLKINMEMLKGTNVIFLNDPGCNADNAIITYNQITPLAISVVTEDEYEWLHMNQKTI